jgi:hypothetical protein
VTCLAPSSEGVASSAKAAGANLGELLLCLARALGLVPLRLCEGLGRAVQAKLRGIACFELLSRCCVRGCFDVFQEGGVGRVGGLRVGFWVWNRGGWDGVAR